MPEMDGFETATLIRQRRQSETRRSFSDGLSDDTHAIAAIRWVCRFHSHTGRADVLRTKSFGVRRLVPDDAAGTASSRRACRSGTPSMQPELPRSKPIGPKTSPGNVSHELRTPMNAIIGMTDLALKRTISPLVREYLSWCGPVSQTLLELLNEILDYRKWKPGIHTAERSL